VERGNWGLVYIPSEGRFGYYDDEDGGSIVYFGAPLSGDGPYVYPRSSLRQPPFDGEYTSYGEPPASTKFALSLASPVTALSGILAASRIDPSMGAPPKMRGGTKLVTLDMYRDGKSIAQIASARSLQVSTIESHLVDLYQEGSFPEAPQIFGATPEIIAKIKAINAGLTGPDVGKLRPIKDRCEHSYAVIKLALAR